MSLQRTKPTEPSSNEPDSKRLRLLSSDGQAPLSLQTPGRVSGGHAVAPCLPPSEPSLSAAVLCLHGPLTPGNLPT